jgi:LysR family transcriptional regulator for metE and metH
MLRLDIRHLQLIVTLSETASLAQAADHLGVTSSALSHRIREAERRLGVPLYEKHGRNLRPTLAAEHLQATAEYLLSEFSSAETAAIASMQGVQHIVRLAVSTYNSFHWLAAFLSAFREGHPEIDVDIATQASMMPYGALGDGTLDVAISPNTILPAGLAAHDLFDDELVAVMPPDHELAGRAFVEAEDLQNETVYTYSLTRVPDFEGDRFWSAARVMPQRYIRVESVEATVELVKAGFGVSVLSKWALKPHIEAGTLAGVRLTEDGLPITWRTVTRGDEAEDGPVLQLVKSMTRWFARGG